MKLALDQIAESPKDISFSERVEELNLIYKGEDKVRDFRFPSFLDVNLVYYRSGREIFLDRKSTRLNSSHIQKSRMPSSA